MSSNIVIDSRGVGKAYTIFKRPEDRLRQILMAGRRRYYEEYWALRDITLSIARGESIAIIGRNGSGKSTFLQVVCGILAPTTGSITVQGRLAAMLELGAGFNPEFTGRENIMLVGSVVGLSTPELKRRFQSIADFAGIGDFMDQPLKIYSSGMQARLAFALMAHVDPDILIVDEILAVGDAAFSQKCMRFIRKFKNSGTLLFVSHDTAAVLALCERAVWLEAGAIRAIGPAKEVCHQYLAAIESEKESAGAFRIGGSRKPLPKEPELPRDLREPVYSELGLVPQGRVFSFDPDAPWYGRGGASIEHIAILDANGDAIQSFTGGEELTLRVECHVHQKIVGPIVGFLVRDRLGQSLFGDNTYLSHRHEKLVASAGSRLTTTFEFRMPYMQGGDYSITAAIAEGDQDNHIQHHWIDEAMMFKIVTSNIQKGLVGIPMKHIGIAITEPIAETACRPAQSSAK